MRSRATLFTLLFTAGLFALPLAAHAGIPFFGPIIPSPPDGGTNVCPAGWGMVMIVVNNIIELAITLAIVFVAPLMIAYAGFLFVVNPVNPSGKEKAKGILLNTVVGIIIALAGWLIVDAVMAVLYDPNAAGGTWSSIITSSGDPCLAQAGSLPNDQLNQVAISGISANGGIVTVNGKTTSQCSSTNTACSPAALQTVGFTLAQANTMSCIAVTENSGNATGCNGNACGTFQIMLTVNPLVGSACGGTLNCPVLCKGNNGTAVQTASCQQCVQAANNPQCNAQTAYYMFSKSSYGPWTPPSSDNTKASACVQQYAGG
ncbi:MAG: pilin [Minisyncoccota bacterium]